MMGKSWEGPDLGDQKKGGPPLLVGLGLGVLLVIVAIGSILAPILLSGVSGTEKPVVKVPEPCDPAHGECIEALEIYASKPAPPKDPIVGVALVWRNNKLSHCREGACLHWTLENYNEAGQYHTAKDYLKLVGCVDMEDGREFEDILKEFTATTSQTERIALSSTLRGRA